MINNKKALYDYFILEKFEAGIALLGAEVKSIRASRANLKDSFIKIIKNEAFLFGCHISFSSHVNYYFKPDELRVRKLLLHKKQILKLHNEVKTQGLSIVPLSIYFNKKNKAKVLIALAKGKKQYDKRETLKAKQLDKELKASLKNVGY